ncbi:MAG: histidinol dehydrogenase [Bacillota bacterium]|jgi:histidinol dehydrogenase
MIKIFDYANIAGQEIFNRNLRDYSEVESIVADIIDDVQKNGDQALFKYCKQFDGADIDCLQITEKEIDWAYAHTDQEFIKTLQMAADNIESFHRHQLHNNFIINDKEGIVLGQKYSAIEKVGLYIPGGTASYPSSVLMNAIPAKIAGVEQITMVTPPDKKGQIPPQILAAAKIAGVDKVYKIGGAQAIAALAYGTESIPKVDKIVGPGNIFVATAKRRVFGLVDIDMIAGPSEILIIADGGANPAYIAADMLSQAEHDKLASAILVTDSSELAQAVQKELTRQISLLQRHEIARQAIEENGKIIITQDLAQAVEISNMIAPEHLEICIDDPFYLLNSIKNAGSIFLGKNVPEALGDYFAGPNHTLPTSGTARFSSPLSVDDFVKKSSFIYYTKEALGRVKDRIIDFAHKEGLDGHAKSISIRFDD